MTPHEFDEKPITLFSEDTQRFLNEASSQDYAVLCGRNNCGKSYLLKTLAQKLGEAASYLGPARYQNFTTLSAFIPSRNQRRRVDRFREFQSHWNNQQQNIDNSPLNLQRAVSELSDVQRNKLIEIMGELLSSTMEIRHTVDGNSMSQQYISVDGHNLSFTSSGYRLIATLVTSMLDDEFEIVLIDEPELGISPEAQGYFADFLFDRELRKKHFPHVKSLIVATHSTVFLDRTEITNNYFVEKRADTVDVQQVKSVGDISKIHFFLLGNRFESLYLPSAIIIVEGKTDHKFVERVVATRFPGKQLSLFNATSDSRTKEVLHIVKTLLGDLQKSPYKDRIFVVLDSVHGEGLVQSLTEMGLPKENVITWSKNGIEYYYPVDAIRKIFQGDGELSINGDQVELNGLTLSKSELVERIIPMIDRNSIFPDEFHREFLNRVEPSLA